MARFKRLFIAVGALLLIAFAAGVYNVVGQSIIEAREATTRMNLDSIRRKVAEFRATRFRFPRGAEELALQPDMLVDIMSGKDFVWTQEVVDGTQRVRVVWQPEPYRSGPWPFGEMRQLALFSDGKVGDCLSEDAAP